MKKIMIVAALCALCGVLEAYETVSLGKADVLTVREVVQVKAIELVDVDSSATHVAKKVSTILGERTEVTARAATNFVYTLVSTNDYGTVSTNVTAFDQTPFLPAAEYVQSYTTNSTVVSWSVTNVVPVVSGTVTNTVDVNTWLAPGDVLFFPADDTFTGKVRLFLEK